MAPQNTPNDARFAGKCAIVTGAGAGIGRATALRLAREGARVIATDLQPDRLDELAAAADGQITTVAGDITDPALPDALLRAADGPVDIVINNAGIMDKFLPAAEIDDATWNKVMDVNVSATMRLNRAALPAMIDAGRGVIIYTSSMAGQHGATAGLAYTASKHAVNGMVKNMAFIYGPAGIRTNAVAPGAVATSIEAPFASQSAAARIGPVMQATITATAQPEQIAAAICWLASDEARHINGAILPVDAGWSVV